MEETEGIDMVCYPSNFFIYLVHTFCYTHISIKPGCIPRVLLQMATEYNDKRLISQCKGHLC